ncbi:type III secretion protein D [Bradyrhizobium elkanii]|uniref:FHA domain-containing protein n=1 Tax=Bradyrhizobium elkanii TaxID=29448 RepID=UPI0022273BB9|nr:FHA domain-containing protein [Bradyrhizobium elkanii]MCW2130708.1 type III secretion protein D [Bradyrhizobium elkanii]MCW2175864.1 type III secretion protein D [Bradyrhizobium elkanii]
MRNATIEQDVLTGDQAQLTLRVLSGPNKGAETSLGDGAWLVGSHDADDLTFADPELAGSHLRIVIEAGQIQITALAPGVLIGSSDCPTEHPTILDSLTPVRVGRTIFSIGPTGGSFPVVDSVVERGRLRAEQSPSAPEGPAIRARETRLVVNSIPWPFRLGAVACGLLIIVYGACVGIGRVVSSFTPAPVPGTDPIKIARNLLRDLNVARGVSIALSNDSLIIDGDLGPEEATKIKTALRDIGLTAEVSPKSVTATALSDAKIIDLSTTVMRAFGIEGSVRVGTAGGISIAGYGPSDAVVKAALHHLQQDVPGVRTVDDTVATPDRARTFLETATTVELRRSIRIVVKPDVILVSGTLTPNAYNEWKTVASRFEERFAPHIRLEAHCSPAVLPTARGVHLGRSPFIVVQNGTRLKVGDNIDHLGKIVVIDHDGMLVRVGEADVRVPYPSKPEWIAEEDQL